MRVETKLLLACLAVTLASAATAIYGIASGSVAITAIWSYCAGSWTGATVAAVRARLEAV